MNPPARPAPELPGLYHQSPSGRPVAVKIGHAGPLSPEHRRRLTSGAGAVAALSAHPHIVGVHAAGVAPDGRPYVVMDHYPGPHLTERGRRGELAVAEVLRIGVQLASALETAHRAGILHGDLRPANVLVSVDRRVGLADFAPVTLPPGRVGRGAEGARVAFTAPEVLVGRTDGSVAADVYGLCATLYLLLAGRPPAWVPGGDNRDRALTARIRGGEVSRLTGVDVPSALRDLVAAGLEGDPRRRPGSALALAEALQAVERERNLPPTPIDISDPAGSGPIQNAGAAGVALRPVAASGTTADPGPGPDGTEPPTITPSVMPAGGPGHEINPSAGAADPRDTGRRRIAIALAALVAAVLVLGAGYAAVSRPDPSELAVTDTADGEASSTTTGATTTIAAPIETTGTETVPSSEPAPDPTDPAPPTTAAGLPSVPPPGLARPTISPPRPTATARPTPAPPPPPTTARPPDPSVCVAGGGGCPGRAYWTSKDHRLHVCDATSDGYVVVAEYRRSDAAGTGRLKSRGGNTCTETGLDLRSGAIVTFRACLENQSGDPSRCSDWVTGRS
jgi:hypothetical protein